MKIVFDKEVLFEAMTPAMGAVCATHTIAAVEGILFTTSGNDKCILSSYDLEKGFRTVIDAQVYEKGSFIINAAKLYKMVRIVPERQVIIEVNDKFQVTVRSGNSVFSLSALPGGDFPNLPDLNGEGGFSIEMDLFKKMVSSVQHAIFTDSTRPILCGAYFKITKEGLRIVSCDGNRLALREKNCSFTLDNEDGYSFIVPGDSLLELCKMLNGEKDEKLVISFGRKHVIFHIRESIFFSRLIDGEYLDYQRVIPKSGAIHVVLDRLTLMECIERASIVGDRSARSFGQGGGTVIKCIFENDSLKLYSYSSEGSVKDEMEIEKTGDDLTIGFNARYLADALRAATGERIRLTLSTPLMSMVIQPQPEEEPEGENTEGKEKEDNGNFIYVISPMKIKE